MDTAMRDRATLNRALAEQLGKKDGVRRPQNYCESLDAAVTALNALGLV
jgi:hypothetical protein